jgi:hypothetical protein
MIYSSVAVLALAASAAIPPFHHIHLHPQPQTDERVELTLINHSPRFNDVKVGGHSYEITPDHSLTIKAPVGTVVYQDSTSAYHRRGEVLVSLTPELNRTVMELK